MNIWILYQYALPPSEPGPTRHYSHGRELMARGHQVQIIAGNFHHWKLEHLPVATDKLWERQEYGGIPFCWIRACGYRSNSWRRVRNMLEFSYRAWHGEWAA